MQLLQNYCKNFCKILQENALKLTNSCKIFARVGCFFAKFLQELNSVGTNFFHNIFVIAVEDYLFKFRVFRYKNVTGILQSIQNHAFRVGSEKRQQWSYARGRDKVTLEKHCFILYFYSDKLSHYKTYDFKKFLLPDAFKHVRLQNAVNKCKLYQILPLRVDYACFLVKCINYQNVKWLKIIYFLQEMSNCCKIVAKILQDLLSNSPILQGMYFLQEFCNSCIDCKNFAKFLQKLFLLWTREINKNYFWCQYFSSMNVQTLSIRQFVWVIIVW